MNMKSNLTAVTKRPWTKPALNRLGTIEDVAATGIGPNQCGGGGGCIPKS